VTNSALARIAICDEHIGLERAFAAGGIEQLRRQLGGILTDRQNTSFEECARQAGPVSASRPERNSHQTSALTATASPDRTRATAGCPSRALALNSMNSTPHYLGFSRLPHFDKELGGERCALNVNC
jgi:hypothetical protein